MRPLHRILALTPIALAPIALAAIVLPACTQQPAAPGSGAVEQEVRDAAQGVIAAYNAQDAAKAASYDAPDYVGIFHGAPNVEGPEADRASMEAQMGAARTDWALAGEGTVTVSASGDMAVYEAPYRFTVTYARSGKSASERGTWIAIFRRQGDGAMKLWRSIGSDLPPEPVAAPSGGV
ncbi:MAG: nuclear transport factor 2 family protein [Sphingomonadales bacterium]|nr:nuclear transport factor 2 family protein [Sphingomonadales bacterium]MBD3775219.1 nuclear transport factor 2 family protein [Paracoccaceae bacterium]